MRRSLNAKMAAHLSGTTSPHSDRLVGDTPSASARACWVPYFDTASLLRMHPLFTKPKMRQVISSRHVFGQSEGAFAENERMQKAPIKEIFIRNLRNAMADSADLRTQDALAKRAGMSPGHLSEIMRGMSGIGIELLNDLAHALQVQPWELLADSETTRQAALAKLMWGGGVSNERVEQHYPIPPKDAPKKEAARPPKKSGRSGGRNGRPPSEAQ